jgi:hypothetical protein
VRQVPHAACQTRQVRPSRRARGPPRRGAEPAAAAPSCSTHLCCAVASSRPERGVARRSLAYDDVNRCSCLETSVIAPFGRPWGTHLAGQGPAFAGRQVGAGDDAAADPPARPHPSPSPSPSPLTLTHGHNACRHYAPSCAHTPHPHPHPHPDPDPWTQRMPPLRAFVRQTTAPTPHAIQSHHHPVAPSRALLSLARAAHCLSPLHSCPLLTGDRCAR